ncbi:MAG TPA: glutamine--tRNA ligase/YqeY domain fusion protein [Longimicrobium sp.]|uniref:glutamine--tRNA ligase/YqeY domain fusion protein n=1 Tax=Longimicrobium sp. TaxID=2029185 RepID=UPI002ED7F48E
MTDIETRDGSEPRTDAYADREALDFIRTIVAEDLRAGKYQEIVTRFPPEPNGYLHIGHAKAILLSYGIAQETGGRFNLRFDDTNPETEDISYVESIADTVRWLGADFGDTPLFAADYFEQMYRFAEFLIEKGLAYVDSSTDEEIREARGTVMEPGRPTAYRDRTAEENLDLFRRMRAGEFPDGAHVLRARIDLSSNNMLLRDPLLYRIRHAHHYRTGDAWCIYPLYDYAHPIEDAIEGITHSLCSLEFDNNRAVYDWVIDHWQDFVRAEGGTPARPHQYEFARGELEYTITSKRKMLELVKGGYVSGWDDPRLPTIAAFRRRGVTPEAIRGFWERMGVAKFNSRIDIAKLEYAIRDDLNTRAPRVLAVLRPLKVTITNYPPGETETFDAPLWPHDVPKEGSRPLPFSGTLYIDRDDFMEVPSRGFHRLSPGAEVRLRYAYVIRCDEVVKDDAGEIVELRCSYDPATRGGSTPDGRQVKGTIQWVSAEHAVPAEVRLYDRLFTVPDPDGGEGNFKDYLNPESLVVVQGALVEPSLAGAEPGSRWQFERVGYFCADPVDSKPGALVFNRTVTLRDAWAKAAEKAATPVSTPKAEKKPKAERAPRSESGRPAGAMEIVRSPELEARRARFVAELGLSQADADVLTRDDELASLFETTVGLGAAPKAVASWIVNVVLLEVKERGVSNIEFTPAELRELIGLVEDGTLSAASGKAVLADMARGGGSPAEIVERRGLRQVSDLGALAPLVDQVIAANAAKADEYRAGKTGLLGFFVGQVMRQSGGNANPARVSQLVQERLGG